MQIRFALEPKWITLWRRVTNFCNRLEKASLHDFSLKPRHLIWREASQPSKSAVLNSLSNQILFLKSERGTSDLTSPSTVHLGPELKAIISRAIWSARVRKSASLRGLLLKSCASLEVSTSLLHVFHRICRRSVACDYCTLALWLSKPCLYTVEVRFGPVRLLLVPVAWVRAPKSGTRQRFAPSVPQISRTAARTGEQIQIALESGADLPFTSVLVDCLVNFQDSTHTMTLCRMTHKELHSIPSWSSASTDVCFEDMACRKRKVRLAWPQVFCMGSQCFCLKYGWSLTSMLATSWSCCQIGFTLFHSDSIFAQECITLPRETRARGNPLHLEIIFSAHFLRWEGHSWFISKGNALLENKSHTQLL